MRALCTAEYLFVSGGDGDGGDAAGGCPPGGDCSDDGSFAGDTPALPDPEGPDTYTGYWGFFSDGA